MKFSIAGCVAEVKPILHERSVCVVLVRLTRVVACLILCTAAGEIATPSTAFAQSFNYNPRPPKPVTVRPANDGQMLVQAAEVDYDYNNSRVSAVGNVQLFYNGTSVEADKVIYDQKTKRLHAEGNIRMTDVDGKI
ncbi:MAG TPA: LPS-assembly protein LptD, partial [Bradyrhizobium sp.]|nr:LPS-assembly protein LptD [Bradyrhizobium sp.]